MEDSSKLVVCRLCLKIVSDFKFKLLEYIERNMLDILVPTSVLISSSSAMCRTCHEKLLACYEFKALWLEIDDQKNTGEGRLNFEDTKPATVKMCSLCFQKIDNEMSKEISLGVKEALLSLMLERCLPELDVHRRDMAICSKCFRSLEVMFSFITDYQITEEKLEKFCYAKNLNKHNELNLLDVVTTLQQTNTFLNSGQPQVENCLVSSNNSHYIFTDGTSHFKPETDQDGINAELNEESHINTNTEASSTNNLISSSLTTDNSDPSVTLKLMEDIWKLIENSNRPNVYVKEDYAADIDTDHTQIDNEGSCYVKVRLDSGQDVDDEEYAIENYRRIDDSQVNHNSSSSNYDDVRLTDSLCHTVVKEESEQDIRTFMDSEKNKYLEGYSSPSFDPLVHFGDFIAKESSQLYTKNSFTEQDVTFSHNKIIKNQLTTSAGRPTISSLQSNEDDNRDKFADKNKEEVMVKSLLSSSSLNVNRQNDEESSLNAYQNILSQITPIGSNGNEQIEPNEENAVVGCLSYKEELAERLLQVGLKQSNWSPELLQEVQGLRSKYSSPYEAVRYCISMPNGLTVRFRIPPILDKTNRGEGESCEKNKEMAKEEECSLSSSSQVGNEQSNERIGEELVQSYPGQNPPTYIPSNKSYETEKKKQNHKSAMVQSSPSSFSISKVDEQLEKVEEELFSNSCENVPTQTLSIEGHRNEEDKRNEREAVVGCLSYKQELAERLLQVGLKQSNWSPELLQEVQGLRSKYSCSYKAVYYHIRMPNGSNVRFKIPPIVDNKNGDESVDQERSLSSTSLKVNEQSDEKFQDDLVKRILQVGLKWRNWSPELLQEVQALRSDDTAHKAVGGFRLRMSNGAFIRVSLPPIRGKKSEKESQFVDRNEEKALKGCSLLSTSSLKAIDQSDEKVEEKCLPSNSRQNLTTQMPPIERHENEEKECNDEKAKACSLGERILQAGVEWHNWSPELLEEVQSFRSKLCSNQGSDKSLLIRTSNGRKISFSLPPIQDNKKLVEENKGKSNKGCFSSSQPTLKVKQLKDKKAESVNQVLRKRPKSPNTDGGSDTKKRKSTRTAATIPTHQDSSDTSLKANERRIRIIQLCQKLPMQIPSTESNGNEDEWTKDQAMIELGYRLLQTGLNWSNWSPTLLQEVQALRPIDSPPHEIVKYKIKMCDGVLLYFKIPPIQGNENGNEDESVEGNVEKFMYQDELGLRLLQEGLKWRDWSPELFQKLQALRRNNVPHYKAIRSCHIKMSNGLLIRFCLPPVKANNKVDKEEIVEGNQKKAIEGCSLLSTSSLKDNEKGSSAISLRANEESDEKEEEGFLSSNLYQKLLRLIPSIKSNGNEGREWTEEQAKIKLGYRLLQTGLNWSNWSPELLQEVQALRPKDSPPHEIVRYKIKMCDGVFFQFQIPPIQSNGNEDESVEWSEERAEFQDELVLRLLQEGLKWRDWSPELFQELQALHKNIPRYKAIRGLQIRMSNGLFVHFYLPPVKDNKNEDKNKIVEENQEKATEGCSLLATSSLKVNEQLNEKDEICQNQDCSEGNIIVIDSDSDIEEGEITEEDSTDCRSRLKSELRASGDPSNWSSALLQRLQRAAWLPEFHSGNTNQRFQRITNNGEPIAKWPRLN